MAGAVAAGKALTEAAAITIWPFAAGTVAADDVAAEAVSVAVWLLSVVASRPVTAVAGQVAAVSGALQCAAESNSGEQAIQAGATLGTGKTCSVRIWLRGGASNGSEEVIAVAATSMFDGSGGAVAIEVAACRTAGESNPVNVGILVECASLRISFPASGVDDICVERGAITAATASTLNNSKQATPTRRRRCLRSNLSRESMPLPDGWPDS